jgi:NADH:ubiquinone oxidoreductase subunit H
LHVADALKLLLKEYVAPTQANIILFFIGPVITLIFALLGYGVIPYVHRVNIVKLRGTPKAYGTKLIDENLKWIN